MGKHKGNEADETSRAQDKADVLDAMWEESNARAEEKRENGTYPYDLDRIIRRP